MKTFQQGKLALALSALLAAPLASANDDFKLTDKLSVTGFIDLSWHYMDIDGQGSEQSMGLDQFEIDLLYTFSDKFKAQVDLDYHGDAVNVEQAFITYAVTDNFTAKAGRFLSYAGWEAAEPTGLYQYSGTGYAQYFYGGYQEGISGLYSTDMVSVAVSFVNDLADTTREGTDYPAIETMLAVTPTEGVTVKAFYSVDKRAGEDDVKLFNLWGSYEQGPWTLAAEYNMADNSAFAGSDASGYLLMANYAVGPYGLTLRYHAWDIEDADGKKVEDMSGITIAPSYTVNDNLLMVFEVRHDKDDVYGADGTSIALEALVTF